MNETLYCKDDIAMAVINAEKKKTEREGRSKNEVKQTNTISQDDDQKKFAFLFISTGWANLLLVYYKFFQY